jgi:uncharacterized protein (UPF0332 family)
VTGENRRRNAREELDRSRVCLQEAKTLAAANLPYGAASRAYYAVYHAAQALLFSVGLEAGTHRGVVALLGEHFVKPGALTPEMGRLLSRLQRDPEDADYLTGAVFTDAQAAETIAGAERFIAAAEEQVGLERG